VSHTKEPWADDGFARIGATGSDQFNGGFSTAICEGPDKQDNARRIVACVNACAGIPTQDLERVEYEIAPVFELLVQTTKQRDKLLAALEEICWSRPLGFRETKYSLSVESIAKKAIASAKAGAA